MTKQTHKAPTLILDIAKLNKAIDSIAGRAKKLDHDVQVAGLSAIAHVERTGDIGPVNRLYMAMGKGARKSALTAWLLAFAKVVANTGEDKASKPFSYDKTRVTNIEGAIETPWFEFKPEPAPDEVFDVAAAVQALIKRAQGKTLAEGGQEVLARISKALAGDPLESVGADE